MAYYDYTQDLVPGSTARSDVLDSEFQAIETAFAAIAADTFQQLWQGNWVTGKAYLVNAFVLEASVLYVCVTAHTAGTFATDLAAGNWEQVLSQTLGDDAVTNAKLRNSAAVSVIGRSANSSGDPSDIAAAANDQVLCRTSDALSFAKVPDAALSSNVRTGTVSVANGGTGATAAAAARTNLGLGAIAVLSSVGDAQITAVSAAKLTTGELPDARLSASVPLITTGSFTATLTGTSPVVTGQVDYLKIGNLVTLYRDTVGALTGGSIANTMSMSGLPAAVTNGTARDRTVLCAVFSGTGLVLATAEINSNDGLISFAIGQPFSTTGFIASGIKGIPIGWTITYRL